MHSAHLGYNGMSAKGFVAIAQLELALISTTVTS